MTVVVIGVAVAAAGHPPGEAIAGRVTSGGYGYTVAGSIAYAQLPPEVETGGRVEVDIFGKWVGAEVMGGPLIDPQGERVRA